MVRNQFHRQTFIHTFPGELIASAGDGECILQALTRKIYANLDGMIIIWTPSATASLTFGADSSEETQYDKEHWKPRLTLQCVPKSHLFQLNSQDVSCTTMQVYDLAWSPTGDYILAGSTDNIARIFSTIDGIKFKIGRFKYLIAALDRKMCQRASRAYSLCSRRSLGSYE
jgi:WD40 repeat protein